MFKYFKTRIIVFILVITNCCLLKSYSAKLKEIPYEIFEKKVFLSNQFKSKKKGDSIIFGNYEQNGNESDGKEPIEWIILRNDTVNNKAILISKYILDCYPFNGFSENVTWKNCSLRNHMNSVMLIEMFNDAELSCIVPTFLLNSRNIFNNAYSGEPTYDFIFIPGIDEMLEFFSNDNFVNEARIQELTRPNESRMCLATEYAKNRGVRVMGFDKKYPGTGNYFLRTSGLPGRRIWFGDVYADYFQAFVSENGEIKPDGTGINSIDDGIRPMVQISY